MSYKRYINKAVNKVWKENKGDTFYEEGCEAFFALYSMLGSVELHDAVCTEMEDLGFGEVYEDIIYTAEEMSVEAGR